MILRTVSLGNTRRLRESETMCRISSGENRIVSRLSAGLAGLRVAVSIFIVGASVRHMPRIVNPKKCAAQKISQKSPVLLVENGYKKAAPFAWRMRGDEGGAGKQVAG